MAGWTTLVQPETLAGALNRPDLVIVDCRFSLFDPNAGEHAYLTSHLPGAAYAHLERDLSDMSPHGDGRHPWPPADMFTAKLSRWGIEPGRQVVAYDDGDGAYAARLWFLLRMLGHEKVAVLDGGWARWTALGLPVSSAPRAPSATHYRAVFDLSRLFDAGALQRTGQRRDAGRCPRGLASVAKRSRWTGRRPCAGCGQPPYALNLVDGRFKRRCSSPTSTAPCSASTRPTGGDDVRVRRHRLP
jgi:thiosulfate/3-mercaptopyruvate sulfurtransferase